MRFYIVILNVFYHYMCLINPSRTRENFLACEYTWAAAWQNQHVCPVKTQISLGMPPSDQSSLCAQWVAKDHRFLHADSEDWSDWVDARLISVYAGRTSHFVGFVVQRLILFRVGLHSPSRLFESLGVKLIKAVGPMWESSEQNI